jgi:lipid A ethanolaminephosphotransferase
LQTRSFRIIRPQVGSVTASILTALYVLAVLNQTFWTKAQTYLAGQTTPFLVLAVGLGAAYVALCVSISVRYVTRPLLMIFILAAAASGWFMDHFGVIIDTEMVRNAAETSAPEAGHLMTPAFALHMFVFGALPCLILAWVRILHRPFFQKVGHNLAIILPCLLVFFGAAYSQAGTFAFTIRQHRDWFDTLNPLFPIGSTLRFAMGSSQEIGIVAQPRGEDARVFDAGAGHRRKPRVTIIVVGETARAESFQLGGYERATNPELSGEDIVYFKQTTSCGTATAVSVPCMFSGLGHSEYTHEKALASENLMDVLTHAGIRTEWWDNNTGSKGMAARIPYKELYQSNDPRFCDKGECKDEILLDQLDSWLGTVDRDAVLVLHQLGSHGPAYYARYPDAFRTFTPDCRSAEFSACHRQEIINAYDNSILYTDHVLATIIHKLKAQETRLAPSMIYMSDHGESLGEKGLFLHGAPWVVAPAQQTHIPFVLWLGEEARSATARACWSLQSNEPQSHDNLFHTVLGLMHVETKVHDRTKDLYAACEKVSS